MAPAGVCDRGDDVAGAVAWPRAVLAPGAVWPFTRGAGATVAVLSTGVDGTHPRLRGRVLPGFDAVTGRGRGDRDCVGTGTRTAGVVAAAPAAAPDGASAADPVTGLAPQARILPVRVLPDTARPGDPPAPAVLARGLDWAAGRGADVVVVADPVAADDAGVRAAVRAALARGVVVVAAAGDRPDPRQPARPYPARYAGVLGAGALGPDGRRWPGSPADDAVALVAPGAAVPTLAPGGGAAVADGTALAAGYVAAAAALAHARRGDPPGADVTRSLLATAAPAPRGPGYGAGVVDPYAAVTALVPPGAPRELPAPAVVAPPDGAAARGRRDRALAAAGAVAGTVLVVLVAAVAVRRGRRRRWRPVTVPVPVPPAEPVEPGPPRMLLD